MTSKSGPQKMSKDNSSTGLLDTAEELVETLDNLTICLRHIDDKYMQEGHSESGKAIDKGGSLYNKLKENLEAAQRLTDSIKREKWRLSRREMSIELRMGELQEYKSHIKKDMTDMNQTVEALSMRVVQLENALCEAQDIQERIEADRQVLSKHSKESERQIANLEQKLDEQKEEVKKLRLQRTDAMLKSRNEDLQNQLDVLYSENHRLKEIIREKEDPDSTKSSEPSSSALEGSNDDTCSHVGEAKTSTQNTDVLHGMEYKKSDVVSSASLDSSSMDGLDDKADNKTNSTENADERKNGKTVLRQSSEIAYV